MSKSQVQLDGGGYVKWQTGRDTSTVHPGWLLLCREWRARGCHGRECWDAETPQKEKLLERESLTRTI